MKNKIIHKILHFHINHLIGYEGREMAAIMDFHFAVWAKAENSTSMRRTSFWSLKTVNSLDLYNQLFPAYFIPDLKNLFNMYVS